MKKTIATVMALLLGASAIVFAFTTQPKASEPVVDVTTLSVNTDYSYDLDQDGLAETISYQLTEAGVFELSVNGATTSVVLGSEFYNPELAIMDIDSEDDCLDLWASCYACSNDICFSALYRFDGTQLNKIWEPERGANVISAADGILTLRIDRLLPADLLIGNHWDQVAYKVENNQVTPVETDTYKIAETLKDYQYEEGTIGDLICAKELTFTTEPEGTDSFTLAAGTVVTPKEIKAVDFESCYVSFETADGQTGWLFSGDYSWDECPFTNICLCD